ncbi:MAG: 6-bladed beta-propeller, partial [Bacteroidia bacterium]|nr:6-bladed beta-propeller [Bacteroidia bacterium]
TEFMAYALYKSTDNEFVFYGAGRNDKIIKTDSNIKVIGSFFPFSLAYRLDPFYPLAPYAGKNMFHLPFCDTLYTLEGVKPDPLIYLDFSGMNFTKRDFDRLALNEQEKLHEYLLASSKYVTCRGFLPVKQQAFVIVTTSNKAYWGLYNLATNQYSFVALPKLVNDIYGSYSYFHPIGITRDEFIFPASPDKLTKDKTSSFYKKYNKVLDGLTELSNPVLLFAKSKI